MLRDSDKDGKIDEKFEFMEGLNSPFGMALIDDLLYVANTDEILVFPYAEGDTKITAKGRKVANLNAKAPNKLGSALSLFDCVTCDKCIPVCPNHTNFSYVLPAAALPVQKLTRAADGTWTAKASATLKIEKKRQYANFSDFCNECGNYDVFYPEDGGPYVVKPRFFGSRAQFEKWTSHDGFFVTKDEVLGRFGGKPYTLSRAGGTARFAGTGFDLELDEASPVAPVGGTAEAGVVVDLTYFHILRWLQGAVLSAPSNYVNA